MVQQASKWSKMAQHGPKSSKIDKNGENGEDISKQCRTNIMILEFIWIYLGEYVHLLKCS